MSRDEGKIKYFNFVSKIPEQPIRVLEQGNYHVIVVT